MPSENDIKKLERRARSLLLNKDIPSGKMELVRSLMKNEDLLPDERYRTIINLVQSCPDKKVELDPVPKKKEKAATGTASGGRRRKSGDVAAGPTETAFYFDYLWGKYKHLKLFKRRYLVHRDNRLGIGFRKRLIPTKKMLKLLRDLAEFQEQIMTRLSPILMEMLRDEDMKSPVAFNYLRRFRSWIMDQPLVKHNYEAVKWMERPHFEREFRKYCINFFAFQKLEPEIREDILLTVENKLRLLEDLKKEDLLSSDSDSSRSGKERRNLNREKKIYDYMFLMRSFLHGDITDENSVAK